MPGKLIKLFLILLMLSYSVSMNAQIIDPAATFKTIHQKSYFRFHYDNDFFTKSDEYYSQGITLEYVHASLKRNPLSKLLIKPRNSYKQYGISFNLFGYTPTSILSDSILFGDRPYAAAIDIGSFVSATDTTRKIRISSAIMIGVIGPAGLGNEIQTGIHRWLKNPLPHGWQYQVQNDVILNYRVNFEKQLVSWNNHFLLNGVSEIQLGTLDDRLSAGINFMVGNFNDPYKIKNSKEVQYYFYGQARTNLNGYDASMQGGLYNRKSPYTISAGDIERVTFQADAGIVVNFKRLYLSYTQSFLSKEFRSGKYHRWGGFNFGFTL